MRSRHGDVIKIQNTNSYSYDRIDMLILKGSLIMGIQNYSIALTMSVPWIVRDVACIVETTL